MLCMGILKIEIGDIVKKRRELATQSKSDIIIAERTATIKMNL